MRFAPIIATSCFAKCTMLFTFNPWKKLQIDPDSSQIFLFPLCAFISLDDSWLSALEAAGLFAAHRVYIWKASVARCPQIYFYSWRSINDSNVAATQSKEIKLPSCSSALCVPNFRNDTAWFKWYRCSTVQWTWGAALYVTLSLTVQPLLFNPMYVLAEGRVEELQWGACLAQFGLLAPWEIQGFRKYFLLICEVNRRWRCSAISKPASLPASVAQLRGGSLCRYTYKNFTVVTGDT